MHTAIVVFGLSESSLLLPAELSLRVELKFVPLSNFFVPLHNNCAGPGREFAFNAHVIVKPRPGHGYALYWA